MPINMDAILGKAKAYVNSSAGQNRVQEITDKVMLGSMRLQSSGSIHTPEEAAAKFIEVLHKEMESSGLSTNAINAISNLEYSSPISLKDGTYIINVYFTGDLSRPSLDEARYGRINDLAMLFNEGVDHKMRPVKGTWHGNEIWSKTIIPGAHFMEQAVTDFIGNYSTEYNVLDIQINK